MRPVRTHGSGREDVVTPYPRRRQVGDRGHCDVVAVRWPQVPGPVRTILVVARCSVEWGLLGPVTGLDEHVVAAALRAAVAAYLMEPEQALGVVARCMPRGGDGRGQACRPGPDHEDVSIDHAGWPGTFGKRQSCHGPRITKTPRTRIRTAYGL